MARPALVWFQHDLRLGDHPALRAAVDQQGPVIPVYIHDDPGEKDWPPGGASRWWLHRSLMALMSDLERRGSRLIIRIGAAESVLPQLASEVQAGAVFWTRRHEPAARQREDRVARELQRRGVRTSGHEGALLFSPDAIRTRTGKPFQVFTPFWKTCLAANPPASPFPAPESLTAPNRWPESEQLDSLKLLPRILWDAGFHEVWKPGEAGALQAIAEFEPRVADYAEARDRPDQPGTSRLSPHLHFGEVSPAQVWHAIRKRSRVDDLSAGASTFLAEIGWREFAHHVLHHFPRTPTEPLRAEFQHFPWERNSAWLRAWQKGETGYPIVDAGMRQLWTTGWMHNRVRMIVGSFLTKHLRIAWREGARWFWDTLVDADLANNTLGWQWISGCGADAAPYFRIFNPVLQGKKFDPQGDYVRRWVPELRNVPSRWIHEPWAAERAVLKLAGVTLGADYPRPIVDHAEARRLALEAFKALSGTNTD